MLEHMEIIIRCTNPMKAQGRPNPSMKQGGEHEFSCTPYDLLTAEDC